MKEQDIQMGEQVNKIVANTLIKVGGIYIPGYGSLTVETTSTTVDGAPIRGVRFSKEERHRSLIAVIGERARCTPEQAEKIFERWLKLIKGEEGRVIEGVGVLKKKRFLVDSAILDRLNVALEVTVAESVGAESDLKSEFADEAESHDDMVKSDVEELVPNVTIEQPEAVDTQVPTPKRSGVAVWFVAVAALFVAIGCGWYFTSQVDVEVVEEHPVIVAEVPAEVVEQVVIEQVTVGQVMIQEPAREPESEPEGNVGMIKPTSNPLKLVTLKAKTLPEMVAVETLDEYIAKSPKWRRFRVVYGVMSSEVNAGRAIVDLEQRCKGVDEITVCAHLFGRSYMVTIFETNDYAEARKFVATYGRRVSERAWIYDITTAQKGR